MKAIEKTAFIADLYQRTCAILNTVTKQYQSLDEMALTFAIAENSWNTAQCLAHLNTYGHYYLPKMEAILAQSNKISRSSYQPGWLGNYLIKLMNVARDDKRYKASKKHQPQVEDPHAVVIEFVAQQETFLRYIKAFERVEVNKTKIPTSINKLVKLRLGDVLAFMVMHNERHLHQIKRIQHAYHDHLAQRAVSATFAP